MHVLVVENSASDFENLRNSILSIRPTTVFSWVQTLSEAQKRCSQTRYDLIVLNPLLSDSTAILAMDFAKDYSKSTPVIIWTGQELPLNFINPRDNISVVDKENPDAVTDKIVRLNEPLRKELQAIVIALTKFDSKQEKFSDDLTKVYHLLMGNGHPGLVRSVESQQVKIEQLEDSLSEHISHFEETKERNKDFKSNIFIAFFGALSTIVLSGIGWLVYELVVSIHRKV